MNTKLQETLIQFNFESMLGTKTELAVIARNNDISLKDLISGILNCWLKKHEEKDKKHGSIG